MKAALKTNINTETISLNQNKTAVKKITGFVSIIAELAKTKITFFVSISTGAGYFIYDSTGGVKILLAAVGVFLFAAASATFNHYQEKDVDAKMSRTKTRPIPSGKILSFTAVAIALTEIIFGSMILYFGFGIVPLALAFFTLAWYNLIYTPLKRKSELAIIPGSLIGALPPVIGWTSAGGAIFDPVVLAFATFLFVWQIPHFWLLMMRFGNEYEKAGMPSITASLDPKQLASSTFVMIAIMVASSLLMILAGTVLNFATSILTVLLGLATLIKSAVIIKNYLSAAAARKTFMLINSYVLLVVIVIISERIITAF